ncbi:hypothetical protein NX865_30785, partial [Burkholderia thailandensis]|uniref:hypothetical protein n=1 Tax=Burkholderia thailandensis TaxID=57975 RepID=UPI00217E9265
RNAECCCRLHDSESVVGRWARGRRRDASRPRYLDAFAASSGTQRALIPKKFATPPPRPLEILSFVLIQFRRNHCSDKSH